ncbi:MAG: Hsp20/alpha crystallin family protein [Solirubrobacteraceae bacterium]
MALIRFEPLGELSTIQNEMNRLFSTFFDQSQSTGRDGSERRWIPAMDLVETTDQYVLRADLPGVREDDVTVQLEDNVLTIAGQRAAEDGQWQGYYRIERAFGAFSRSLTLPAGIDPDHVQARFDRGVLEVMIPKPEQQKPRQVQIQLNRSDSELGAIEGNESADAQTKGEPERALA